MSNYRLILEGAVERELALLIRCQDLFGISAASVAIQLSEDLLRPMPDTVPQRPAWRTFNWPVNGDVDLRGYWREHDRGRPYLGGFAVS